MRYASVCDGIGAVHVAWLPLGWECAWHAEIDAFPSAVVEQRHGDAAGPNLGDITEISDAALEEHRPIDLLVGGTPCQSFSVAGLRGGMADPRGNLALGFLGLAARTRAEWVVWENVPGVLSSSDGRDFGAFLGGLVELGYGFAYRVLDAQFFGLAQRRKRVFVVGHLGDWRRAAAVLLERASLSGHPPPSREAGAEVAGTLEARPVQGCDAHGAASGHLVAGPPCHDGKAAGSATQQAAEGGQLVAFTQNSRDELRMIGGDGSHAGALAAQPGMKQQTYVAFHATQDPISGDVTPALGRGNEAGCWTLAVAQPLRSNPYNNSDPGMEARMHVYQGASVRRLTERECERLQGFPDDYTAIQWKGKPAPAGRRYRALGNSMAVPCMAWLGKRIAAAEAEE